MRESFTRKELCELMEEFVDRANAFKAVTEYLPDEPQRIASRSGEKVYRECGRLVANLISK